MEVNIRPVRSRVRSSDVFGLAASEKLREEIDDPAAEAGISIVSKRNACPARRASDVNLASNVFNFPLSRS